MDSDQDKENILAYTTEIVSAYFSGNQVPPEDIPDLIERVYKTITHLGKHGEIIAGGLEPAVPINRSVTRDTLAFSSEPAPAKLISQKGESQGTAQSS